MLLSEFKKVMAKAKPGQHIAYHTGDLADQRTDDRELDGIARFVMALFEIGVARPWQRRDVGDRRITYYVTLTKRLRTRRDQSGSFQDAERMMEIV